VPLICVSRGSSGGKPDELRVDVSPVRPADPGGALSAAKEEAAKHGVVLELTAGPASDQFAEVSEGERDQPIHKLPELCLSATVSRGAAKAAARALAEEWACAAQRLKHRPRRAVARLPREAGEEEEKLEKEEEEAEKEEEGASADVLERELEGLRQEIMELKASLLTEGLSRTEANRRPEVAERVARLRPLELAVRAKARREAFSEAHGYFDSLT